MKKYLLFLAIVLVGLGLPELVNAQADSSPSAGILKKQRLTEEITELTGIYRGQLTEYRQAEKQFKIDQAQYDQLQTLASITTVTESAQAVMASRARVLLTYFELLRINIVAAEGIELSLKNAVIQRLTAQQNWLQLHQQAISVTNDREEFNQLADTFLARLPIFEETYQEANSLLLIGTFQDVFDRLNLLSIDMSKLVSSDSGVVVERSFRETNRVIDDLKTQFTTLWLELTDVLSKKRISSFYDGLARDTEETYADLNKLISFLAELLRQI